MLKEILGRYGSVEAELSLAERGISRQNINFNLAGIQNATLDEIRRILGIQTAEIEKLRLLRELIDDEEFQKAVSEGQVTFGMIKPKVNEAGSMRNFSDQAVAQQITHAIKPPLSIMALQDFWIPRSEAENLYGHLRDRPEILEEVLDLISGGAATGIILFDQKGNAVQEWRAQIGPTHPEKGAIGQLRHRFAFRSTNNAVHGADSAESSRTELDWFKRQIVRLIPEVDRD